jgi:hypothetical protein
MKKPEATKEIELHPDAWQRFERAAGVVAKTPPQHRVKSPPKQSLAQSKKHKKAKV